MRKFYKLVGAILIIVLVFSLTANVALAADEEFGKAKFLDNTTTNWMLHKKTMNKQQKYFDAIHEEVMGLLKTLLDQKNTISWQFEELQKWGYTMDELNAFAFTPKTKDVSVDLVKQEATKKSYQKVRAHLYDITGVNSVNIAELDALLSAVKVAVRPSPGGVTSRYGEERPAGKHKGVDFGCGNGRDIIACLGGEVTKVVYAPNSTTSYGSYIDITAPNGEMFRYAHLQEIYVEKGNIVKTGAIIAYMGTTGNSTGVHLHFEVFDANGERIDPAAYLGIS